MIQAFPLPDGRYRLVGKTFDVKDTIKELAGQGNYSFNKDLKCWEVTGPGLLEIAEPLGIIIRKEMADSMIVKSRRDENPKDRPDKAFGSPLNRVLSDYWDEKLGKDRRDFCITNIDMFVDKWACKATNGKRRHRLVESKHIGEGWSEAQKKALMDFAHNIVPVNDSIILDIFGVIGNEPKYVEGATVINMKTGEEKYKVPFVTLMEFLHFGMEFDDL